MNSVEKEQGTSDSREAVRMSDVAELAEVSISTVSRFLRGEKVREPERIAEVIAQLGYRPNAAAQHLRSQRTHAIAVVQHDITNPHLAGVVRGVTSVAVEHEYSIYLVEGMVDGAVSGQPESAILDLSSRVDGFICAALTDEDDTMNALKGSRRPAILIEFEPRDPQHDFDVVVIDEEPAASQAVNYLIGLGHTEIAVIAGPDTTSPGRNRLEGARKAMEAAGIELRPEYLEVTDFTLEGGYQAAARIMARSPAPTAIFACNNLMSLGCLHCLHDLGTRIPADVSFVSFDPLVSGDLFNPPPTFVDRPQIEQGALAMRLLDNRIMRKAEGPPRRIVLSADLVVRESCAPPKSRRG
ncbi:MAG: LacI family DNA-binding transcriptional regulator [Actinobacteria bacterium]|nr:LacI family DNA-binding transcriptional regulator [Actinomycetota bacterium]